MNRPLVKEKTRLTAAVKNIQTETEDRKEQEKVEIMEHHNKVEKEGIKELQKLQLDYEAKKGNVSTGKASHEGKTGGGAQNG